jgi:hypothetical protein
MSDKLEKARIGKKLDRRIKIPKSEYPVIFELHKNGEFIRAIARLYNVNKRLIQFILFPERLKKNYQNRLDHGGSKQYYDKDKWKIVMREHRQYKRSLLKKGLIK